jgi:putative spermidine/putrescine transport system substrate-binding protein
MAQKLAEFLLTPQAQAAALEFGNQIPSNVKTQPGTPAAQATVERFKGYMKTVVTLDWDAINATRPEWNCGRSGTRPLEQDGHAALARALI